MTKQKKVNVSARVLAEYYLDEKTLQEIGDMYGVSRERIRQILVRGGFDVKDMKSCFKVQERTKNRNLADRVLLETTNRTIDKISKELRSAKHNLSVIKNSRSKLIAGFKDTLFEIKAMARMGIKDIKTVGTALLTINNLVIDELKELDGYMCRMSEGD